MEAPTKKRKGEAEAPPVDKTPAVAAKRSKARLPFYGESKCHRGCGRPAYWSVGPRAFCGRCSGEARRAGTRRKLTHNPRADTIVADTRAAHRKTVELERLANARLGRAGTVTARRMVGRGAPLLVPGVLNVFPNWRHAKREDGLGLERLSPKFLGPVRHGQPGLPDARTIEAFHQANKVFPWFFDASADSASGEREEREDGEADASGNVRPEFFAMQRRMYADPYPYRHQHEFIAKNPHLLPPHTSLEQVQAHAAGRGPEHPPVSLGYRGDGETAAATEPTVAAPADAGASEGKEEKRESKTANERPNAKGRGNKVGGGKGGAERPTTKKKKSKNKNAPLFSLWVDHNKHSRRISYVESRQLYCSLMDVLARREPQWERLRKLVAGGTNVCIVGYDAQSLDRDAMVRYLDGSRPFGHECVLATMLQDAQETWPWRLRKTLDFDFEALHPAVADPPRISS